MEKKVIILLSTYNGEKYLSTQIDSILAQDFFNWILVIRDDGSKDNTINIIQEYLQRDSRIEFISDDLGNLRSKNSFGELMKYALERYTDQFYMFSDQDDFWYSNKINSQIQLFIGNEPQLIYSNYEQTDGNLNVKEIAYPNSFHYTKEEYITRLLMQNWIMGCTIALNAPLAKLCYPIPQVFDDHDQFIAAISAFCAEIKYLHCPTIRHRIHQNNVTQNSKTKHFFRRLSRGLKAVYERKRYFEDSIKIGKSIRERLIDNGFTKFEKIEQYIKMFEIRGAEGIVILDREQFLMYDRLQNRLLRIKLKLK